MHPILGVQNVLAVAPATEEAHLDVRAAHAEGFLAVHGIEDRGARVLLGPYTGQSTRIFEADVEGAKGHHTGQPAFDRAVDLSMPAKEVVLAIRTPGVVGVGAARHAELVGVVAADVLQGEAVFERLASEASGDAIHASDPGPHAEEPGAELVTRKFVVG